GSAHGPSLRWADPTPVTLADGTAEVWWICEDHTGGEDGPRTDADGAPHIERYVVAVPLDGSAAEDPSALRRITPSARFVAHPRVSPDGSQLAWISWEHPQMPWDGTQLHVAPLMNGRAGEGEIVAGGTEESILQPEWLVDQRLLFLSDASGWWHPWVWSADGGAQLVFERAEECALPMWVVGSAPARGRAAAALRRLAHAVRGDPRGPLGSGSRPVGRRARSRPVGRRARSRPVGSLAVPAHRAALLPQRRARPRPAAGGREHRGAAAGRRRGPRDRAPAPPGGPRRPRGRAAALHRAGARRPHRPRLARALAAGRLLHLPRPRRGGGELR